MAIFEPVGDTYHSLAAMALAMAGMARAAAAINKYPEISRDAAVFQADWLYAIIALLTIDPWIYPRLFAGGSTPVARLADDSD